MNGVTGGLVASYRRRLFHLLNNSINLTTRELNRAQDHLRQFILQKKGLNPISTFGLWGGTFSNMIAQRTVPFLLAVHKALEDDIKVVDRIRALFGRAYCGVVGRPGKHKFAVFGPPVKLATHIIVSKDNPMILVEKNVHLLKSLVFFRTIMWPSLVPQETGSRGGQ